MSVCVCRYSCSNNQTTLSYELARFQPAWHGPPAWFILSFLFLSRCGLKPGLEMVLSRESILHHNNSNNWISWGSDTFPRPYFYKPFISLKENVATTAQKPCKQLVFCCKKMTTIIFPTRVTFVSLDL
jgi:hypothetical protein